MILRETPGKNKINELPVWYWQVDNSIDPYKTCFPTSFAMCITGLEWKREFPRLHLLDQCDEFIINDIKENYSKYKRKFINFLGGISIELHIRYYFKFWQVYGEKILDGFKCTFVSNPANERIRAAIDSDAYVITSTKLTGSGHIVVINGYDLQKPGWYVSDPYGEYPYKTEKQKIDGEGKFYAGYWWRKKPILIVEYNDL